MRLVSRCKTFLKKRSAVDDSKNHVLTSLKYPGTWRYISPLRQQAQQRMGDCQILATADYEVKNSRQPNIFIALLYTQRAYPTIAEKGDLDAALGDFKSNAASPNTEQLVAFYENILDTDLDWAVVKTFWNAPSPSPGLL